MDVAVALKPGLLEALFIGGEGKHKAHLRHHLGEELVEQRAAHQADNVLVKPQAVCAEGLPILAILSHLGGFDGIEHQIRLVFAKRLALGNRLQLQGATHLEYVANIIRSQTANDHTLVTRITGQPFPTQMMQRFTHSIARGAVGIDQLAFNQRHARQQATTDNVFAQLNRHLLGLSLLTVLHVGNSR